MTRAFSDLLGIILADDATQKAWLDEKPLRAILPPVAAAEIVACDLTTLDVPQGDGPRRVVLHLREQGSDCWFVLPAGTVCTGLWLHDGPLTGPRFVIGIETDFSSIRTNFQELFRVIGSGANAEKTDAERRAAWMALSGAYEHPRRLPPIPSFRMRHLGEVHPDPHGFATAAAISVPAFADRPLDVEMKGAQPDRAEAFEAALDAFLSAAPRLKAEATHRVHENMLRYINAVYRDPGGPVPPAESADPVFERLLSLSNPEAIWSHVRPQYLMLHFSKGRGTVYVRLSCTCAWEEEHGLSLVWRDGTTLSFVGEDGMQLEDS